MLRCTGSISIYFFCVNTHFSFAGAKENVKIRKCKNGKLPPNIWNISKKSLSLQRRIPDKFVISRKCETIWWIQLNSMRIKR